MVFRVTTMIQISLPGDGRKAFSHNNNKNNIVFNPAREPIEMEEKKQTAPDTRRGCGPRSTGPMRCEHTHTHINT